MSYCDRFRERQNTWSLRLSSSRLNLGAIKRSENPNSVPLRRVSQGDVSSVRAKNKTRTKKKRRENCLSTSREVPELETRSLVCYLRGISVRRYRLLRFVEVCASQRDHCGETGLRTALIGMLAGVLPLELGKAGQGRAGQQVRLDLKAEDGKMLHTVRCSTSHMIIEID